MKQIISWENSLGEKDTGGGVWQPGWSTFRGFADLGLQWLRVWFPLCHVPAPPRRGLKEPARSEVAVSLARVSVVTRPWEGPWATSTPLKCSCQGATCSCSADMSLAVCDFRDRRHKLPVCPKVQGSWVLVDAGGACDKTQGP